MLSGCKAVILGAHGPKNKDSLKFFAPPDISIYLSPFESYDETNVFSGGRYVYMPVGKNGTAYAVFSF